MRCDARVWSAAWAGCFLASAAFLAPAALAAEPAANVALTKSQLKAFNEELLPAYRSGDMAEVIRSATEISTKLSAARRPTADRLLADNGLPTLADLSTDTRLKLVEQGLANSAPPVQPREALVLLGTLKGRIEKLLATGNEHAAFGKPEPVTLDDFDKLFWSMHVFSNQFSSAERFFIFAQELKSTAKKFKPKGKDDTDVAVLETDWAKVQSEMVALREKFALRDRDLRVARLKLADKVLTDSKDVAERLLAALAVDVDGELLPPLLKNDTTFPADQTQKVEETIDHARKAAGREFLQKSRWLFTGLHWWVRGRYGMGTAGRGLLKDPAALKSPDAMFGLLMPINPQIPTAPTSDNPVPLVDRRHHYLWQFETQQVVSSGSANTNTSTQFKPISGTVTTMTHFY